VEELTQDAAIVEYGERTAALGREILDVVSLADSAAKWHDVAHRSKERRMRLPQRRSMGSRRAPGRRPRSGRLRERLEPWPER
jgi:hypothetical protein